MRTFLLSMVGWLLATVSFSQDGGFQTVIQKGHSAKITALEFSKDGRFFVTGSADNTVKLWDLKTGREIRTFKGHKGEITDVHIDEDNEYLVSSAAGIANAELRVWDIASGANEKEIQGGKETSILAALFTGKYELEWAFEMRSFDMRQDGMLIWATDNKGVKVGKISKSITNKSLPTNWQPSVVRFSPKGDKIVAGGQAFYRMVGTSSNEVLIWNADDPREPLSLKTQFDNVVKLSFDQSGTFLAVLSHTSDSTITKARGEDKNYTFLNGLDVYNLNTNKKIFETNWTGFNSRVLSMSPDGGMVASSFNYIDPKDKNKETYERLVIYDLKKGKELTRFDSPEPVLYSMDFSPDGRMLIANGNSINFWRTGSWTRLKEIKQLEKLDDCEVIGTKLYAYRLKNESAQMTQLDFESGDYQTIQLPAARKIKHVGQSLFICRGVKIEKYDLSGQNLLATVIEKIEGWDDITNFIVDDRGDYLVCYNNQKSIFVQPLKAGLKGFFLEGHRKQVNSVAIRGSLMASGADDNKIFLWDLETKAMVGTLLGHNAAVNSLDFNPDGSLLVSGGSDSYVKLWDVKKKSQIETLWGHHSPVYYVVFSKNGETICSGSGNLLSEGQSQVILWDTRKRKSIWKIAGNEGYTLKVVLAENRVYSIGNDATVKMIDPAKGAVQFTYAPLTGTDFILVSNDNYYISTKAGLQFVHFVRGTRVYGFDNFDLKYNRPDKVLERLGSHNQSLIDAYKKMYNRRLKRNGFTEAAIDAQSHLPVTSILNLDSIPYLSGKENVTLQLEFADEKFPLKYYNVWVNSVPYFGFKGKPLSGNPSRRFKTRLTIPLNEGHNKIEVGCINEAGARSPRELIEVLWNGKRKPELYLVTVCASEYANPNLNLAYSVKDGKDMAELFNKDKEFGKIHLTTLYNQDVTRANFAAVRQELLKSNPDDEVILFMAGHGVLDKNFDFHFVTYDMNMDQPGVNAISFDQIESFIDSIPARKKMVLLDACHSGGIDKEEIEEKAKEVSEQAGKTMKVQNMDALKNNVFKAYYGVDNTFVELMEEMFHNLGEGSGAYVISAASGKGYALESSQWNNGVFTYSILDGLKNDLADKDKNGVITVSELKSFLFENVVKLTGNQQKPTCRKENPDLDFVVWRK